MYQQGYLYRICKPVGNTRLSDKQMDEWMDRWTGRHKHLQWTDGQTHTNAYNQSKQLQVHVNNRNYPKRAPSPQKKESQITEKTYL